MVMIPDTIGGSYEKCGSRVRVNANPTLRTRELHGGRWVENYLYYGSHLYNSIISALVT